MEVLVVVWESDCGGSVEMMWDGCLKFLDICWDENNECDFS